MERISLLCKNIHHEVEIYEMHLLALLACECTNWSVQQRWPFKLGDKRITAVSMGWSNSSHSKPKEVGHSLQHLIEHWLCWRCKFWVGLLNNKLLNIGLSCPKLLISFKLVIVLGEPRKPTVEFSRLKLIWEPGINVGLRLNHNKICVVLACYLFSCLSLLSLCESCKTI